MTAGDEVLVRLKVGDALTAIKDSVNRRQWLAAAQHAEQLAVLLISAQGVDARGALVASTHGQDLER